MEIYTYLFYDVIDNHSYSKASLYSDTAMALYSLSSFFFSPCIATLSDTIGRRPVFLLAAFADSVTFIICGLVPNVQKKRNSHRKICRSSPIFLTFTSICFLFPSSSELGVHFDVRRPGCRGW